MRFLFWLKMVGISLLIMAIDILLSIAEVFIYSLFVPDQPQAFYEAHAQVSAPWVAIIGGAVLMYTFTAWYVRKNTNDRLRYAIALPSVYQVIDVIILIIINDPTLMDNLHIVAFATVARYGGSFAGYYLNKGRVSRPG